MNKMVKVALIEKDLTIYDIAGRISRTAALVSMILNGKILSAAHRPIIAKMLGLQESDIPRPPRKRERRSPR